MERDCLFLESGMFGYGARAGDCARALGYRPVLLARDPQEYAHGVIDVRPHMAEVVMVDTLDIAKLLRIVLERDPAVVIGIDDFRVLSAALLANFAGLRDPALTPGLVNVRFKDRMRARLADTHFAVPHAVYDLDRDVPGTSVVGYPCVVKPVDEAGSSGVRICHDPAGFAQAVGALDASLGTPNGRGYRATRTILVEAFIPGQEYSAEAMYDPAQGHWRLVGVTRKLVTEPPFAVEAGHVFPTAFPPQTQARIEADLDQALLRLGLRQTAAHAEFKLDGDRFRLIEVNARIGGDMIPELVESALGIDLISAFVRLQAGHPIEGMLTPTRRLVAGIRFIMPPRPGTITALHVPPEPLPGEVRRQLPNLPRTIASVASSYDRLGFIVATAADERALEAALDGFVAACRFEYQE
jgi:biotin carboxylase